MVDNASTDGTRQVAERRRHGRRPCPGWLRLERKGRGGALRQRVVARSSADVVAYMDADLSTGLDALIPLRRGDRRPGAPTSPSALASSPARGSSAGLGATCSPGATTGCCGPC